MEKLVREAIDFKRTRDSRKSLKLGKWSPGEVEKTVREAQQKFLEVGYDAQIRYRESDHFNFILAQLDFTAKTTSSSNYAAINGSFIVYYTESTEGLKGYVGDSVDEYVVDENGPWVLINTRSNISEAGHPIRAAWIFNEMDDLIKELVKQDFIEPVEDWNWLDITKKRIALIES